MYSKRANYYIRIYLSLREGCMSVYSRMTPFVSDCVLDGRCLRLICLIRILAFYSLKEDLIFDLQRF